MQINFTFKGEPVAAQRPRYDRRNNRTYTPTTYLNYKKKLSTAIRRECNHLIGKIPKAGTSERSKYLAENKYKLHVNVYRAANRGDIDNFIKSVMDAIQDAYIIGDDSQIYKLSGEKFIDKENPRVEFELRLIE